MCGEVKEKSKIWVNVHTYGFVFMQIVYALVTGVFRMAIHVLFY